MAALMKMCCFRVWLPGHIASNMCIKLPWSTERNSEINYIYTSCSLLANQNKRTPTHAVHSMNLEFSECSKTLNKWMLRLHQNKWKVSQRKTLTCFIIFDKLRVRHCFGVDCSILGYNTCICGSLILRERFQKRTALQFISDFKYTEVPLNWAATIFYHWRQAQKN